MQLLKGLGLISIVYGFGLTPLTGHEGHHQGYSNSDCMDWGHHWYYQGPQGSYQGPQQGPQAQRQWRGDATANASINLETVEGKVTEVVYLPGATPSSGMVEIRVQTANQGTVVRLAPSGFLKQGGMALREGDMVSVQGYRVAAVDGEIVVATELRKGGKILSLRDTNGRPAW